MEYNYALLSFTPKKIEYKCLSTGEYFIIDAPGDNEFDYDDIKKIIEG